jgi:heme o synthase
MKNGLKKKMNGKLKSILELVKFPLCLFIAFSASFGFIIAEHDFSIKALTVGFFVLLLAFGCAILNNIQDREYDASFLRTCNRVLVLKKFSVRLALFLCISFIISGLTGLLFFSLYNNQNIYPFLYGILALVFYNFLYTPLKKYTLSAIIPGAMSGMLPPLIGWSSAGANAFNQKIMITMMIFGLWQIPHFFLILLKSGKDPGKKKYPEFNNAFSTTDLKFQVLIWCGLYSLSMLFYLIIGKGSSFFLSSLIALNGLSIIFLIGAMIRNKHRNSHYNKAFAAINISLLVFMAAGIYQHII